MEEATPNCVFLKQQSLLLLLWVPENRQALPTTQGLYKKKLLASTAMRCSPMCSGIQGDTSSLELFGEDFVQDLVAADWFSLPLQINGISSLSSELDLSRVISRQAKGLSCILYHCRQEEL